MSEDPEPDYGPIFIGNEADLMRIAAENITAASKPKEPETMPTKCEECDQTPQSLARCETCLFWLCALCFDSANHKQMHADGVRNEGRL